MWETQDPNHNKRLPFSSEAVRAVCVQVEDVRLWETLENSPALTMETLSEVRVIYFFDSTFIQRSLCALCYTWPVAEETKMRETWSLLSRHLQSSRRARRCVQTTMCITKKELFWFKGRPLGRRVPWQNYNNNQFEIQLLQPLSFLSCISLVFTT